MQIHIIYADLTSQVFRDLSDPPVKLNKFELKSDGTFNLYYRDKDSAGNLGDRTFVIPLNKLSKIIIEN